MKPIPSLPSAKGSSGNSSGIHAGKGTVGKPDSGPLVGYGRGPTGRIDLSRPVSSPSKPAGPSVGKGGKSSQPSQPKKDAGSVKAKDWSDVRKSDPAAATKIHVSTKVAGQAHKAALSVAVGSIGGVLPGDFRGGLDLDDDWTCDPSGWDCWDSCGWYWGASCSWWAYPFYWAWYYPCWWWYTYPYYGSSYCYYPATTVVYTEPQVVYAEGSQPASEYVGEGVVSGSGAPASNVAESPLVIAAQRYLELGDRAFREGRYFDAVQFYAKAVEFAPDQGALYLVLADALFAAGDYHYGAYAIRRALELDPALIDSRVDKHSFYPDPKLFDEQLATLERYLGTNPSDRDARLVLALNYLLGARPKDAVRTIEASLGSMTDDAAAQRVLESARAAALVK